MWQDAEGLLKMSGLSEFYAQQRTQENNAVKGFDGKKKKQPLQI